MTAVDTQVICDIVLISRILEENEARMKRLRAEFDPVTGKDAPGDRVLLHIPDFALPDQWVPKEMLENKLIKNIIKYGSIQDFIDGYPFDAAPSFHEVEVQIRRLRHKYDFINWAYMCIKIKAKTGGRVRFKLNYAQIQVLALCEHLRKSGLPIDIIICKARQWGGSTFSIFYQMWLAFKWRESHSFVVAAQNKTVAKSIVRMLTQAMKTYPAWDIGLPENEKLTLSNVDDTCYELRDSRKLRVRDHDIYVGTILEPDGIRGFATSGAHYSETGVWKDTPERRPGDLIRSISGGIPVMSYTMQVMESTPKGAGNFFHEVWKDAKNEISNFHPIFIPWYFIPHDTLPIDDKEEFIRWLWEGRNDDQPTGKWKDSGKHYWWLWTLGATLEGINWYRYKRLSYNDYALMASEAPSDDIEAFQFSGKKVFDFREVDMMRKTCRSPLYEGELVSDAGKGEGVLRNIRFNKKRLGNLKIWEFPDTEANISDRYLVCVDIGGRSAKADWSVIRVFDRFMMTMGGKPELVAQMRYHTDHDLLAYDAIRIARWYNDALLVFESNTLETKDRERDTDGNMIEYILDTISGLYSNLYARKQSAEQIEQGEPKKWGFHTNVSTKPGLIANLQDCIRDQLYVERWDPCLDEMAMYQKNDKGQFAAPAGEGNHDDMLMCTAIALWVCFREMELPKWVEHGELRHETHISSNSIATF
jgi:hypothetical protein